MEQSERKALIVVDMLNDFLYKEFNPKLACANGLQIIPSIKKLAYAAMDSGVPVIYASDAHLTTDPELKKWGPHAMQGTEGSRVIPELPTKGMYTIERNARLDAEKAGSSRIFNVEKGTYSGFFETPLHELLKLLKVDTVYITGLHTHICDRHTTADADFRGYNIFVVKDAVQSFTKQQHETGLQYIEDVYNAKVKTVDESIKDFKAENGTMQEKN